MLRLSLSIKILTQPNLQRFIKLSLRPIIYFSKKLPTDASASKCGHPFCGRCIERVLKTRKAVCSICKTVIIRSNIHKIGDIDKTIQDLQTLAAAVFKDSGISYASALSLGKLDSL